MRVQTSAAHDSAVASLVSLADVVRALPNIVVMEGIREHVQNAIHSLWGARCAHTLCMRVQQSHVANMLLKLYVYMY